ncbi:MAG: hypothetical protein JXA68_07495 [Ignavibacteriales bacterium]|nr:hypothetical protein [Ignavibacteriales bacterium]
MLTEISLQGLIIIPMVLVMIVLKLRKANGEYFYAVVAIGMILFAIINFIIGLSNSNIFTYLIISVGIFILLFIVGLFSAKLFSGKTLSHIQSSAMVFLAPFTIYPFLIIILLILKLIF